MMNIFKKSLVPYKTISTIKNCREIVFSNGGHLFACQSNNNISVFKFYTAENPNNYVFKKHNGLIRKISWLQDDTGFISIGWDSVVYFWKLDQPDPIWTYKKKNVEFTCVVSFKSDTATASDLHPYVYVTGTDRSIHELKGYTPKKEGQAHVPEATVLSRYEQNFNLS